ncbi:phosphoribosylpyrophosphate synthetase [Arachidicoccus sp.]|uniref:phosphoribosylpyrophosphate synthetase n=1 Tax=Arachidicoccus sp. TaxID=1872624 RepID=UPI003D21BE3A
MKNYDTVSEAVNDLINRGYTHDFNIKEECIVCGNTGVSLSPDDFEIDEVYRFEGETDPGDEMIVYAISAKHVVAKGVLVNAFGTYSDAETSRIVKRLYLSH